MTDGNTQIECTCGHCGYKFTAKPEPKHRLICGDCTDAAVVARVMSGEKARLVFTSPPYADQRDYEIGKFDWLALANGMFDALPIGAPCDILINLGLSYKDGKVNAYWQPWLDHCESAGHALYGWYVWDKCGGFPGEWNGRLAPAHEWVFHFSIGRVSANKWIDTLYLPSEIRREQEHHRNGKGRRQQDGSLKAFTSPELVGQPTKIPDSVIRVTREMARGIHTEVHPATYPVELVEFAIRTWGGPSCIVFDPFAGSGTTGVACERLGRKARLIEIAPVYCSVILQRFQDMGLTPTRQPAPGVT